MARLRATAAMFAAIIVSGLIAGCAAAEPNASQSGQGADLQNSSSQNSNSQNSNSQSREPAATAAPSGLIRADSREVNTPAGAKATLVLFTDYQCPYCAKMDGLIQKAKSDYPDKLRIVVRNYPLPMHQNAPLAAQAVEAAAEQGSLEPMAAAVFAGQQSWAKATAGQRETLTGYAQGLGLDMTKFEQDFSSAKIQERVSQDLQDATALGLRGTPSVVLNGKLLSVDSSDYTTLKLPIDQALAN